MGFGFGSRARIGQLYPSGGLCDYELQAMAPAGVQFVTTRLAFRKAALKDVAELTRNVEAHARLLADAEVQLIAFNCTAASLIFGPDVINRRITAATGIASTTTIDAVLAALTVARVHRFALLTPYLTEVVAAEREFFEERGYRAVATAGLPCADPVTQGSVPPARWRELAHSLRDTDCDGLLISCAGIQIAEVLGAIEDDFGRPVIASNQALVWHCLRLLGLPDRPAGYGALLRGSFNTTALP
jgi:maleate isomerase